MGKKREVPLTHEEMLMFGKMCGCEKCKFCEVLAQEKIWLSMVKEVKNSKRRAEEARKAISEGWLWKTN